MKQELTQEENKIVADLIKKEIEGLQLVKDIYNLITPEVGDKIETLIKIVKKL